MGSQGVNTSFLGLYTHAVDDKGRVSVPAKFRRMGDATDTFVATRGLGSCLFLYPHGEWEKVLERLARRKARVDGDQRRHYLQLMRHTAEVALDAHGRISLPAHLASIAGIDREVVFVGAGEVVELWDPDRYEAYLGEAGTDYEGWIEQFL